ncbi:protein-glutamine gamma-glutamyltransferase [Paenibacillus sp. HB172176]|uniref:protein-glutamine gamma-glutamyltransferase n=1 Tax=Paenibacillus sp. HB172176 TaxID=2493690 RepID=UPI00143BA6C2|nr:protein-glutamine gamma-glutamyltransferase [Paenibacillus sp. HB172176]
MIEIAQGNLNQIPPRMLTDLEKKMLLRKQSSPVTYWYPSLDALVFELKMRSHTVQAAKDLYASGVSFGTFSNSRCNEAYWYRTPNGGFRLRQGVLPSVAIRDIFTNGSKYAFECAGAIIIVFYKAVLETIGDAAFNRYFQNLYLYSWETDQDLQLIPSYNLNETYYGDALYFKNPDYDRETPEWQGENVIMLDDNLYYGHGIGMGSSQDMIMQLNKARMPGAMQSAYLDDFVLTPDFERLRSMTIREGEAVGR